MARKLVMAVAVTAAVGFTLAGCGLQQPGTDDGGDSKGSVTIYSPRPSAITDEIIPRFEEETGYNVQLVTLGAAEIADRIRAEKSNVQADVWWGGTSSLFSPAAEAGLIEPWGDDVLALVDDEYQYDDDKWVAEQLQLQLFAYNTELISEAEMPKDWDELLDPQFKDKILIRDVAASGTMRAIYSAMIARFFEEDGTPDRGYEWLKKLDANTKDYAANPEDLYLRLERQEAAITLWNQQDILAQAKQGATFAILEPTSGSPINTDGVAKVKGGSNPEGAEAFAKFLLSVDTQEWLANNAFQIPTIELEVEPDWLKGLTLKEFEYDRAAATEHESEWIDYWLENIKNQG
ncbi:extracellular solute-binding protein [Microbacterium lacticum]|uniref:extracellular solute-binding protein n=1 Tax=Microbacterium lacticum TaxID=33885 RepID=UPI001F5A92D8|nr:extracellular solute-binding protein [Microbacterium lacticum]